MGRSVEICGHSWTRGLLCPSCEDEVLAVRTEWFHTHPERARCDHGRAKRLECLPCLQDGVELVYQRRLIAWIEGRT